MKNANLYQLITAFSSAEIRAFRKFLQSPYFNQREDVLQLFDYLIDNQEVIPTKIGAFQHLFPNQVFEEQSLRYVMSYLNQLAKQFLIIEKTQADTLYSQQQLVESLHAHGLNKLVEREAKSNQRVLLKQSLRNATYFEYTYWFYHTQFEQRQATKRRGELYLQEMGDYLTIAYVIRILTLASTITVVQRIEKRDYELLFLEEILKKIEAGSFADIPVIQVHYYAYRALNRPEQISYFQQLKTLLAQQTAIFTIAEAADIYRLAISFCIRQFNGGIETYAQEALDLYKTGLDNQVFLENGVLSRFTFNNIVQLGLRLKQFTWTHQFIENYRAFLPEEERSNTYTYNRAIFYYRQQQYDKVLELLQQTQFSDTLYNLDARRMLIRIYYEQDAWSALESQLDSFSVYLHRQTNIGYHRKIYLNLLKFMRKMLSIAPTDALAKTRLREEITKADVVAEREWLINLLR